MPSPNQEGREELMSRALQHLRSALQLLDEADAPAHLGARVDLVIHELYLALAQITAGGALSHIDRNADPQ